MKTLNFEVRPYGNTHVTCHSLNVSLKYLYRMFKEYTHLYTPGSYSYIRIMQKNSYRCFRQRFCRINGFYDSSFDYTNFIRINIIGERISIKMFIDLYDEKSNSWSPLSTTRSTEDATDTI